MNPQKARRMQPTALIKYIVWYATQQDTKLTMNRLVKFLYLADLYYARIKNGQTITGFPWRFIYYGPYCSEVWSAIDKATEEGLICKETYESKFGDDKEYNLFWCRDDAAEELGNKIHVGVIGQLQKAIKEFGDDTPQLLDYVYFDTEPMKDAKKGNVLDFSKAGKLESIEKIQLKKLSPEKINQAREKIKKLSDGLNADRKRLLKSEQEARKYKDESYYKFLEFLDGEELEVGLKGTAKIKIA